MSTCLIGSLAKIGKKALQRSPLRSGQVLDLTFSLRPQPAPIRGLGRLNDQLVADGMSTRELYWTQEQQSVECKQPAEKHAWSHGDSPALTQKLIAPVAIMRYSNAERQRWRTSARRQWQCRGILLDLF